MVLTYDEVSRGWNSAAQKAAVAPTWLEVELIPEGNSSLPRMVFPAALFPTPLSPTNTSLR
ncbi:hypothetical protein Z043_124780 [Scleropages formosus]|uniref:Uncharacterized protein n=1 Tax=Scleropages formosus TaxID=113540 RepID=A0A0P7TJ41_SCLFO|nr:hypothetical protein Z043_124780 [Scleropages formosus]